MKVSNYIEDLLWQL